MQTTTNGAPPADGVITRDTPVGFELMGVKKKAAIQLMGSRLWGRFNPNHWDPVYAAETGLAITVCHYPPGTSKWNRIEHRMFSFITMNWRGRPLTSLRTIVELISATTTDTGLSVQAAHDPNWYPKGVKITDAELAAVPLDPHDWHGEWNYTLNAQSVPA